MKKLNHKNLKQKESSFTKYRESFMGHFFKIGLLFSLVCLRFRSRTFIVSVGLPWDFYFVPVAGSAHMAEDGERIGARFCSLDRNQPLRTERRLY